MVIANLNVNSPYGIRHAGYVGTDFYQRGSRHGDQRLATVRERRLESSKDFLARKRGASAAAGRFL
jgi:hypothetical protein